MDIFLAKTDDEIRECHPVMAQLRPHVPAEDFLPRVRRMEQEGFRLAGLRDGGVVRAAAGFRIYENLHSGRQMYVDDLVTDADARSKGHGRTLLAWLADHARSEGCVKLELDSGTHRTEAHRFYFRERMHIANFHFERSL